MVRMIAGLANRRCRAMFRPRSWAAGPRGSSRLMVFNATCVAAPPAGRGRPCPFRRRRCGRATGSRRSYAVRPGGAVGGRWKARSQRPRRAAPAQTRWADPATQTRRAARREGREWRTRGPPWARRRRPGRLEQDRHLRERHPREPRRRSGIYGPSCTHDLARDGRQRQTCWQEQPQCPTSDGEWTGHEPAGASSEPGTGLIIPAPDLLALEARADHRFQGCSWTTHRIRKKFVDRKGVHT